MSDAPDRPSPEVEAFLAPERRRPDPPAGIQNDVFSRIGATLGWPGGPGPDGSDPSGGAPTGGTPTGGASGGDLAAHGAKHLAAGGLAKTIATLAVGGALGAGVHEAYDRGSHRLAEPVSVSVAAPPVAVPAPPPAMPPPVERAAETEPPAANSARPDRAPAKPQPAMRVEVRERDRSLGAERALIEQARTALSREQNATALAVLERHAREFPQGELEEERESLQVQVLVGLERFEQARKVGARFKRRYPRSIFGAVVDEALKSIP